MKELQSLDQQLADDDAAIRNGFSMEDAAEYSSSRAVQARAQTPATVLDSLQRGNTRFWMGVASRPEVSAFERRALIMKQHPSVAILGCSDSRIPAEQLLGLKPGDLFVHRNIANVLTPTDLSSVSVVEFAVRHLKVEHAVVCGHTGCGGVAAALGQNSLGVLDQWLAPVRRLRVDHQAILEKSEDKSRALAEMNVINSLETLRMHPAVVDAMRDRGLQLHGLIFNLETGCLEAVEEGKEGRDVQMEVYALKQ